MGSKYESPEKDGGPHQSYEKEAPMEVSQSGRRVGQDSLGMGWGRRVEQQKKKLSESTMSVKHSVAHRPKKWERLSNRTKTERSGEH